MKNKITISAILLLIMAVGIPGSGAQASEITGTLSSGGLPSATGGSVGGSVGGGSGTISGTVGGGSTIGGTVTGGGGSTGGGGGGGGGGAFLPTGTGGSPSIIGTTGGTGSGGTGGGSVLGASIVAQGNNPSINPTAEGGPALPGAGYPPSGNPWIAIGLVAAATLTAVIYRRKLAG